MQGETIVPSYDCKIQKLSCLTVKFPQCLPRPYVDSSFINKKFGSHWLGRYSRGNSRTCLGLASSRKVYSNTIHSHSGQNTWSFSLVFGEIIFTGVGNYHDFSEIYRSLQDHKANSCRNTIPNTLGLPFGPCSWCWPMFKLLNIFESDPQSVRAHFPNFTFGYRLAGGKNHLITHLIQLGLNPYVCNYLLSVLVTTKP